MTAKTPPSPKTRAKMRQVNIGIPADRWPDIVRIVAEEQVRTGQVVTIAGWARRVILDRAAA